MWKGDTLVVDLAELEEMDASEIHAKILNAKEVILPKSGDNCKFRVALGTAQPCGGDRENFLDESKLSPPTTFFQDSYPDAGEARDDFWI